MPNLPYIDPELVKVYQSEIARTASPATSKRKTSSLNRFFNWAQDEGHMDQNPLEPTVTPTPPKRNLVSISNVLKLGMLGGLVVLIFLIGKNVKLPIPFNLTPAGELGGPGIPASALPSPTPSFTKGVATPTPSVFQEVDPIFSKIYKDGVLTLEGTASALKAIGGLLIEGKTVTISTPPGSDGDIAINPDGAGIAHFLFEGNKGNFLNAEAPNLTSGSLYYGVVANNATGYDLLKLQSGSNPVTRFSVDGLGNTGVGGNLDVAKNIQTSDTTRITSGGALTNITGYTQTSGNFSITQGAGNTATISKNATALSDVLTLTLDERPKPQFSNSTYSTLKLRRYDGASEAMALLVDAGNAQFNSQLRLGQFASNPTAIGQGSVIFNTADTTLYLWNGTSWTALGGGATSGFWQRNGTTVSPATITDTVGIGTTTTTATALLDLTSTAKGFLAPRMTTTQRDAIVSPATGLMIYNTTTNQYNVFNGTSWGALGGSAIWSSLTDPTTSLSLSMGTNTTTFTWGAATLTSNLFTMQDTASNTGTGYLLNLATATGSTLKPLHVSSAGTEALAVDASGNVGVGTITPGSTAKLDVNGNIRIVSTTSTLQIGNQTNATYNRIASSASTANGLSSPNDLFIQGKQELNGVLFLNGGNISSSVGTATIVLCTQGGVNPCSTPSTLQHTLTNGSWLIENPLTGNVGQAALFVNQKMVNQDVLTASASGTPLFTVKYSGNVGIGTTSPNYPLDVSGGNTTIRFGSTAADSGGFLVSTAASTAVIAGGAAWNGTNWIAKSTTASLIQQSAAVIQFLSNTGLTAGSAFTPSERMRIDTAGNVGIGTTSPNFAGEGALSRVLTLSGVGTTGADVGALELRNQTATAGFTAGNIDFTLGSTRIAVINGFSIGATNSGGISLQTMNAGSLGERMRIDNAGNVGIGTTAPGNKLDVGTTATGTTYIAIGGTNGINQANLRTTLGTEQSVTNSNCGLNLPGAVEFDLGGGGYGFYPQVKQSGTGNCTVDARIVGSPVTASYRANISLTVNAINGGSGTLTLFAQQRFIQASPPYFVDGYKMNWFLYYLRDKVTGKQVAGWSGEDPSYEYIDGETFQTHPHPFAGYYSKPLPTNKEIVMIDPTDVYRWINEAKNKKISLLEYLNDYMEIDPAEVTPPTSPTTGNPIRLPAPLVWRKLKLVENPIPSSPATASTPVPSQNAYGDLAERFPVGSGPLLGPGDIVDIHARSANDSNNVLEKTKTAYSPRMAGIISTKPTLIVNNNYEPDTPTVPLALSGEVLVNVSPINGPIRAGDSITSSEIPGLGMKATQAGPIVARAINDFDAGGATYFSHKTDQGWQITSDRCGNGEECYAVGQVVAIVTNSWYDPDVYLTGTGDLKIVASSTQQVASGSSTPATSYILQTTDRVIDRVGAFANFMAANIKAGAIETQDLTTQGFYAFQAKIDNLLVTTKLVSPIVETKLISPFAEEKDIHIRIGSTSSTGITSEESKFGKLIVENASGSAVASIDETGNASFAGEVKSSSLSTSNASVSGELYADKIHSTTLDDIQKLLKQVETDQKLLTRAGSWNVNTATESAKFDQLGVYDLYVTDKAAINSLSLSQTLAVGTDLVIQSSPATSYQLPATTINTLSAPLSLQSLALAPLEIMAGKFRIETTGDVKIQGNVAIAGNLEVSGSTKTKELSTEKLIVAASDQLATPSAQIVGNEITTNATAGYAMVPAGVDTITIKNSKITDYTLIYVTPTASTQNNVLYVKSKGTGFFTVGFSSAISSDVSFDWWVIEVK